LAARKRFAAAASESTRRPVVAIIQNCELCRLKWENEAWCSSICDDAQTKMEIRKANTSIDLDALLLIPAEQPQTVKVTGVNLDERRSALKFFRVLQCRTRYLISSKNGFASAHSFRPILGVQLISVQ
jgi:hypothetical protein